MKNLLIAFIFILVIAICVLLFTKKENKNELAKHYKISKPTLQKWVQYFPCKISLEEWKKKRKLTVWESSSIKHLWGVDPQMALNKSQIADQGSASPKTLAKCVKENLEKIGLTEEAWDKCSIFPPVISQRIIDILIGKPEPTSEKRLQNVLS